MTTSFLELHAYQSMLLARAVQSMAEEAARLRAEADRLARVWRLHGANQ